MKEAPATVTACRRVRVVCGSAGEGPTGVIEAPETVGAVGRGDRPALLYGCCRALLGRAGNELSKPVTFFRTAPWPRPSRATLLVIRWTSVDSVVKGD